jgi:DNA invertase Pin-like site-specific DNA recombinase
MSARVNPTTARALAAGARQLKAANEKLEVAKAHARTAAIVANDDGISESEIARALGVNRLTVRRWLGK